MIALWPFINRKAKFVNTQKGYANSILMAQALECSPLSSISTGNLSIGTWILSTSYEITAVQMR